MILPKWSGNPVLPLSHFTKASLYSRSKLRSRRSRSQNNVGVTSWKKRIWIDGLVHFVIWSLFAILSTKPWTQFMDQCLATHNFRSINVALLTLRQTRQWQQFQCQKSCLGLLIHLTRHSICWHVLLLPSRVWSQQWSCGNPDLCSSILLDLKRIWVVYRCLERVFPSGQEWLWRDLRLKTCFVEKKFEIKNSTNQPNQLRNWINQC